MGRFCHNQLQLIVYGSLSPYLNAQYFICRFNNKNDNIKVFDECWSDSIRPFYRGDHVPLYRVSSTTLVPDQPEKHRQTIVVQAA